MIPGVRPSVGQKSKLLQTPIFRSVSHDAGTYVRRVAADDTSCSVLSIVTQFSCSQRPGAAAR
jgi:hypothetical protein